MAQESDLRSHYKTVVTRVLGRNLRPSDGIADDDVKGAEKALGLQYSDCAARVLPSRGEAGRSE